MTADVEKAVLLSRKDGYAYHRIEEQGKRKCGAFKSDAVFRDGSVVVNGDDLHVSTKSEAMSDGYEPCGSCFRGEDP